MGVSLAIDNVIVSRPPDIMNDEVDAVVAATHQPKVVVILITT